MTALASVPRETIDPDEVLVLQIPLDQIDIGPNVRVNVEGIEGLAESIKEHGVLQPIKVRASSGRWVVVWGQRRVLASSMAGRDRIPAIVADARGTDAELAIEQLVENIARADLLPMDRARAMRTVVDAGTSQADLARELGLHPSTIANDLGLLEAPAEIRTSIEKGELTPAHAKAIKGLAPKTQLKMAKQAIEEGWSAHELEEEVQEAKRQADADRVSRERDAKQQAAFLEQIQASIASETEKKKVPTDALIVVESGYNRESGPLVELLKKAGYPNARASKGWNDVSARPTGGVCNCTAWKAAEHTNYDYSQRSPDGFYAQIARVSFTKGCIDRKHDQAKSAADEAKRQAKEATARKVQQHVREIAIGVAIPATSSDTPLLIGFPRILAEAMLWDALSYRLPDWAAKRGGLRTNPWASIRALADDELASILAAQVADDFRDKAGYHVDWRTLAVELGLVDPDPVLKPAGKKAKAA